jgi:hypothetical protein
MDSASAFQPAWMVKNTCSGRIGAINWVMNLPPVIGVYVIVGRSVYRSLPLILPENGRRRKACDYMHGDLLPCIPWFYHRLNGLLRARSESSGIELMLFSTYPSPPR